MGPVTRQAFNRTLNLLREKISIKYSSLIAYQRWMWCERYVDREMYGLSVLFKEGLKKKDGFLE